MATWSGDGSWANREDSVNDNARRRGRRYERVSSGEVSSIDEGRWTIEQEDRDAERDDEEGVEANRVCFTEARLDPRWSVDVVEEVEEIGNLIDRLEGEVLGVKNEDKPDGPIVPKSVEGSRSAMDWAI